MLPGRKHSRHLGKNYDYITSHILTVNQLLIRPCQSVIICITLTRYLKQMKIAFQDRIFRISCYAAFRIEFVISLLLSSCFYNLDKFFVICCFNILLFYFL